MFEVHSEDSGRPLLSCDPQLFSTPKSLAVSGGTASFFAVRYVGPAGGPQAQRYGRTPTYWIGKDLAHATDEIDFYEGVQHLDKSFQLVHKWSMDYGGILVKHCEVNGELEAEPRQLILLENLRDGVESLRMLDIKVGNVTAVRGWKGKSLKGTLSNRIVDLVSTSNQKGIRLEGFDNPPLSLQTRMDGPAQACFGFDRSKKFKRLVLQRLATVEALVNFADMSDLHTQEQPGGKTLLSIEYSEALLYDLTLRLCELVFDARNMPVAQMWIGSSVAIGCDSGRLPGRTCTDNLQRMRSAGLAKVKVFDWGRSELGTAQAFLELSEEEQEERVLRWRQWHQGVARIMLSSLTAYYRQFLWNALDLRAPQGSERFIVFELWDCDTLEDNDYIGSVSLPLAATRGRVEVPIESEALPNQSVLDMCARFAAMGLQSCDDEPATLEVEVEEGRVPPGSRLERIWYITVHGAYHIPALDLFSPSDPLVQIQITGAGLTKGPRASSQTTWDVWEVQLGDRLEVAQVKRELEQTIFQDMSRIWGGSIRPENFLEVAQCMLSAEDSETALDQLEEEVTDDQLAALQDMLDRMAWVSPAL